jgi:hypothetical protein
MDVTCLIYGTMEAPPSIQFFLQADVVSTSNCFLRSTWELFLSGSSFEVTLVV